MDTDRIKEHYTERTILKICMEMIVIHQREEFKFMFELFMSKKKLIKNALTMLQNNKAAD